VKIELEIPDPKFKPGDVVRIPDAFGRHIIALVISWIIGGEWRAVAAKDQMFLATAWPKSNGVMATGFLECGQRHYTVVYQLGSSFRCPEGGALRPGKVGTWGMADLEADAELFNFEGEIVDGDTVDNINAREAAWESISETKAAPAPEPI
jgi:hypothetical protein